MPRTNLFFKFSILISAIVMSLDGYSQNQSLTGRIIDKNTLAPIEGALVSVHSTHTVRSSYSFSDGTFIVPDLKVDRYDITISHIGYTSYIKSGFNLKSGANPEVVIRLVESENLLSEVEITSKDRRVLNEAATVSAKSFEVEELNRIPGGLDDPARMLRKFPGVSPSATITVNNINIRGNAARAVRWRLEDMDIYNPNHFGLLGGSGGSLTIFSQHLLTNTDFYSGAFPADYGNTLGGVFDMRFRNGNSTKHSQSVQLSFLGADVATEGPIGNRSTYIVNYRYSTTGLVEQFLNLGGIPVFQDISFKLNHRTKNNTSFDVFGLAGASSLTFTPVLDTAEWNNEYSNFGRSTISRTGTFGTSLTKPIGKNSFLKSIALVTGMNSNQIRYYVNSDYSIDTTRVGDDSDVAVSWHTFINKKFSPRHSHRSGIIVNNLYADVKYLQGAELGAGSGSNLSDTLRIGQGNSQLLQGYSRSQYVLNEKTKINLGAHFMYFALTNELSIEPRLGLSYQLNPASSLRFAYGLHSQVEPFFTYISQQYDTDKGNFVRRNEDLRFNKAHHLTAAYYLKINDNWRFGTEVYYQKQFNLVVGKELPISRVGGYDFAFESFDLDNGGSATNYGVELAIERGFDHGYFFMANTSLFEANYTANDGITRPSMFNANYIVNGVAGKEWTLGTKKGKTNFLNLNVSVTYSGAQYYTNIDVPTSIARGMYTADYANPNTGVQDPLLLVDASILLKKNKSNSNSQLTLQISNVLNQRALVGPTFDRENGEQDLFYGSGVFPVLSWRKSF